MDIMSWFKAKLAHTRLDVLEPKVQTNTDNISANAQAIQAMDTDLSKLEQTFQYFQRGSTTFTNTTDAYYNNIVVTFPTPFPVGYKPVVDIVFDNGLIGTKRIDARVALVSETDFTVTIMTLDRTNFDGVKTTDLNWKAM